MDESLEELEGYFPRQPQTNAELVGNRIIIKQIGRDNLKRINFAKMYGGKVYGNHMRARKTR